MHWNLKTADRQTNSKNELIFTVPPRWILEPTDKAFAQGSDAKVECKADGFPRPQVTWKRAAGKWEFTGVRVLLPIQHELLTKFFGFQVTPRVIILISNQTIRTWSSKMELCPFWTFKSPTRATTCAKLLTELEADCLLLFSSACRVSLTSQD